MKKTARLLKELNPDFVPLLVETLFLLSKARLKEDYEYIIKRLEEREEEFNEILVKLRGGAIASKPLDFKQRFAHTLVACKRLIQRLKSLAENGKSVSGKSSISFQHQKAIGEKPAEIASFCLPVIQDQNSY